MNFRGFYGNEPIKAVLNAHPFHAYLIEGPVGSGKKTLADLITNALVCEAENAPCGVCRQCYKIREQCHPDVIRIPSDLPVDELRRILADLPLRPNDARHKIYRIDNAEKLRDEAQNLLLKSLEEPPEYAVFLLLTTAKERLFETVRSRCQTLSPAPLPESVLEEHFRKEFGTYGEREQNAVLLSAGYLGQALALYRDSDGTVLQTCRELDEALRRKNAVRVLEIFSFSAREELTEFYGAFSLYAKRRLREAEADKVEYYANLVRALDGAQGAMGTNVNVQFWNTNLARLCLAAT